MNAPAASSGAILGQVYEIGPKTVELLSSKPATLQISYEGSDIVFSPDKRLVIAQLNGGRWVPIGGTMDEEEGLFCES